jgi:hypothetical protein
VPIAIFLGLAARRWRIARGSGLGTSPRFWHKSIRSGRIGIRKDNVVSNIYPFLEIDADIVSMPPGEPTSDNCSKVAECEVKIYRQKAESIRMHSGADLGKVVSDARMHLSPPAEEQQAVNRLFDHLQSNLQYIAALALAL